MEEALNEAYQSTIRQIMEQQAEQSAATINATVERAAPVSTTSFLRGGKKAHMRMGSSGGENAHSGR